MAFSGVPALGLPVRDVEAKRFDSGTSKGMQRVPVVTPRQVPRPELFAGFRVDVAGVRFHGLVPEDFEGGVRRSDEVRHLNRPADGSRGWPVAAIRQSN